MTYRYTFLYEDADGQERIRSYNAMDYWHALRKMARYARDHGLEDPNQEWFCVNNEPCFETEAEATARWKAQVADLRKEIAYDAAG